MSEDFEVKGEPTICLACVQKAMGRRPDSLTWTFAYCSTCKEWTLVTKTKHIPQLRRPDDKRMDR